MAYRYDLSLTDLMQVVCHPPSTGSGYGSGLSRSLSLTQRVLEGTVRKVSH